MAKLVLSLNGVVQQEHELHNGRLTIGRKPDSDIHINNLVVSGRHALVITSLDDSFIEDLGSTNGTYVNSKLIKQHALKDGDVVSIGRYELKYINEHAAEEDDDFEKTMVIKPGSAGAAIAAAEAAKNSGVNYNDNEPSATKSGMPLGCIKVLNGPIAGKKLELTRALITLGKPGVQVASISRRPKGYFLTHRESDGDGKRYPVVNGAPIGSKAYQLNNNDLIELADIKLEFTLLV